MLKEKTTQLSCLLENETNTALTFWSNIRGKLTSPLSLTHTNIGVGGGGSGGTCPSTLSSISSRDKISGNFDFFRAIFGIIIVSVCCNGCKPSCISRCTNGWYLHSRVDFCSRLAAYLMATTFWAILIFWATFGIIIGSVFCNGCKLSCVARWTNGWWLHSRVSFAVG